MRARVSLRHQARAARAAARGSWRRASASLQTPYKGMLDGLCRCAKEEGISGLWKGVTTNLILVSNPTVHYFIYDRLKLWAAALVDARGKPLNPAEFFVMGAIAKCIATVATYPVQVAQAQLRNDRRCVFCPERCLCCAVLRLACARAPSRALAITDVWIDGCSDSDQRMARENTEERPTASTLFTGQLGSRAGSEGWSPSCGKRC